MSRRSLKLISGGGSPVTRDELISYLLLDGLDTQDDILDAMLKSATDFVEAETNQQLLTAVYQWKLDEFPSANLDVRSPGYSESWRPLVQNPHYSTLKIPVSPISAVASVKYLDLNAVEQTIDTATYTVDTVSRPGRVVLNQGAYWPFTRIQANAVTVEFTAGYGAASAVPEGLKIAVKLLAGHWYNNRDAVGEQTLAELPLGIRSLIDQNSYSEAV
jgi:uncharacterized phiE125 gp8 family phage protein